jgi:hypothetical protein
MDRAQTSCPLPQPNLGSLLFSALENTDVGAVILDPAGTAVYMNEAARTLLGSPSGRLPAWTRRYLGSMLACLSAGGGYAERWEQGQVLLRVTARPLARPGWRAIVQITVARSLDGSSVIRRLSKKLRLPGSLAHLLALVWCGMSDDEIAQALDVHTSTIETHLYFLYERLGVERRPAAVIRAARALAA